MNNYNIETEIDVTIPIEDSTQKRGKKGFHKSKTHIHMGRVTGIDTSDGTSRNGAITFVFVSGKGKKNDYNVKAKKDGGGNLALPLFPGFRNAPLKNELIFIIPSVAKIKMPVTQYFYISAVNILNTGVYNPEGENTDLMGDDNLDLGEGIIETNLSKLRKLILSPGDTTIEGKFGNTIRLGNSNTGTPYKGDQNSPITIIRNGQKDSPNSLLSLFEDIDGDNSSIYLTKGQIIPINVVSTNLDTFGIKDEENMKTANNIESLELTKEDINDSDTSAVVSNISDTGGEHGAETETQEIDDTDSSGIPIEDETQEPILEGESDQVFTPINSDLYNSIQPTSDPIATDPPPSPPPTIPENADIYFLENGFYVYFEEGRHKLGAIVMDGSKTVLIGIPSFEKTRKELAEEVASEVGSPIHGIEDPTPNSELAPNPGNLNSPDDPIRLDDFIYYYDDGEYIQKEILYKIYKDSNEYYAIGPDYPNNSYDYYVGGSVISNDDNSGIASVINSIEAYWAL